MVQGSGNSDYDKTRIGYEINFTKYFYEYKGLRPSAEIKAEIEALEFGNEYQKGIAQLLKELGAETVVAYGKNPDGDKESLKLTNGLGVDKVVEVAGEKTINKSVAST